jgi:hypothetical protein
MSLFYHFLRRLLLDIMKLGVMPATIGMLLTCKIGFAATDAVTGLKLVEMGVPKVGQGSYCFSF